MTTAQDGGILLPILGAFDELRKATVSFVMSVRLSAYNSAPTGRILMKLHTSVFFENLSRKFKFHQNLTRIMGTLHEDLCTFMTISGWILLRMRNFSDKSSTENQHTIFMFNKFFLPRAGITQSVQRLGTGSTVQGSKPCGSGIFRTRPDRPWGPQATYTMVIAFLSGG